jgi:hypothetical protein
LCIGVRRGHRQKNCDPEQIEIEFHSSVREVSQSAQLRTVSEPISRAKLKATDLLLLNGKIRNHMDGHFYRHAIQSRRSELPTA